MSDRVQFVGGPMDGAKTHWEGERTRMVIAVPRQDLLTIPEGDVLTAVDVDEHVYLRHTKHPQYAYYVYPR